MARDQSMMLYQLPVQIYITNNFDNIGFGNIDIDLLIFILLLMLIMLYQPPFPLCLYITNNFDNVEFGQDYMFISPIILTMLSLVKIICL